MQTIDFERLERWLPTVERPARYIGSEWNQPALTTHDALRVGLAFPDLYELGMSHLGLRILYHLLNDPERVPGVACERVFAVWPDMQELMQRQQVPLFTLETRTRVRDLDVLGFSLPYEMLFTNVLRMLELAGIPLRAAERGDEHPLVVVGGPATYNPEPLAEFVDVVFVGEAEESLPEFCRALRPFRRLPAKGPARCGRAERLAAVREVPGLYFPALTRWEYDDQGRILSWSYDGVEQATVAKRVVADLEAAYFPTRPILPHVAIVHDRANLELHRGCLHGCRFCQAGMIMRPQRLRSRELLLEQAREVIASTGWEELGLASLNSVDHPALRVLIDDLHASLEDGRVAVGLPSLRVDRMSVEIAAALGQVKRTHLTLAPEAGSQRLRDVVNKVVTEADILSSVEAAVDCGWRSVKLYLMIGLPTETDEDVLDMAALLDRLAALTDGREGRSLEVTATLSPFVPQSHTPFQWCGVTPREVLDARIRLLRRNVRRRKVSIKWRDTRLSEIEVAFARGDRRMGAALLEAARRGMQFDGWSEHFDYQRWRDAFAAAGVDPDWYVYRERDEEERFPWEVVSPGVDRGFLWRDWERARRGTTVPNCFLEETCIHCGLQGITC